MKKFRIILLLALIIIGTFLRFYRMRELSTFLANRSKTPLNYDNYASSDLLYVVTEPGINLYEMKMWEITSFGPFQIDKKWPIQNGYLLYRLSHISV